MRHKEGVGNWNSKIILLYILGNIALLQGIILDSPLCEHVGLSFFPYRQYSEEDRMSRKIFRSFFVLILVSSLIFTGFTPVLAAPPTNDNFANAEVINSLPFSAT